jgi:hypothetical protein
MPIRYGNLKKKSLLGYHYLKSALFLLQQRNWLKKTEVVAIFPAKRQRKGQYDKSVKTFTPENVEDDYRIN